MYASIYDKSRDEYYKSYIYGIINLGFYEKCIVLNPNTNTFKTIQRLDVDDSDPHRQSFIHIIDPSRDDFTSLNEIEKKDINKKLKLLGKTNKIIHLAGYTDVLHDFDSLEFILKGKEVHKDEVKFKLRTNTFDGDDWNQIDTQEDANNLMKIFGGFHDSVIESFTYLGESKMTNPKMEMEYFGKRRSLSMIFHSGWYGKIELCFEGVIVMRNAPAEDNYSDEIFGATLIVKDGKIFWADDSLEEVNLDYNFSFVYAYNLRWRTLFKSEKSWKENFK